VTSTPSHLLCDGCGQLAAPEHIAHRLLRLEWTTRYRPLHIQALLLSGIAPHSDSEFFYSPEGLLQGEAANLLAALNIHREGKSANDILTEFQKRGLLLVHLLECPINSEPSNTSAILEQHLPRAVTRIRRSLKPKRVLLISNELLPLVPKLQQSDLGCPVFAGPNGPFQLEESLLARELDEFQGALGAVSGH
jgi:hypothetical protein